MHAVLSGFKALADETRLRLANILARYELNVNEVVSILGMGQSRVSRHLKILAESGLLTSRRDGLWVFYAASRQGPGAELMSHVQGLLRGEVFARDLSLAEQVLGERDQAAKHFFDAVAGDWDRLSRDVLGGFDLALAVAARMPECRAAADLGCGAGLMLPTLKTKAEVVIGVDSSPKMLETARRRFAGSGETVSLRIGRLEHLPVRDEEADFALMSMVLHHLSDPLAGIREAWRILGPRGRFVVAEFRKHDSEVMRRKYNDLWLGFTTAELRAWFGDAGFSEQETAIFPVNKGLSLQLFVLTKTNSTRNGGNDVEKHAAGA